MFFEVRKSNPTSDEVSRAVALTNIFHLTLTGGEPLLSKEQLYSTMDILQGQQVDYGLNSNLHLLKKEDARILKEKRVQGILTSILGPSREDHDSLTKTPGSFDTLMRSLEYIINEGVLVSANMVAMPENYQKVYETGRMLNERFGMKVFCATPKVPSPCHEDKVILTRSQYIDTLDSLLRLEDDLNMSTESLHPALVCMFEEDQREKYRKYFETRGCVAGFGTITFSINGDVRACSHYGESFGNILKEPLEVVLKKMEKWSGGEYIPSNCSPCYLRERCRGGCRVEAEAIIGDKSGVGPYMGDPVISSPKKDKIKKELVISTSYSIGKGNIRFRENPGNTFTIYRNPKSHAEVNGLGLQIYRRIMAGKTVDEIKKEIDNKEIEPLIAYFIERGLLVSNG